MGEDVLKSFYADEAGFKRIADLMNEPIWISEPRGVITWTNKAYREVTGIYKDRIHPEDWVHLPGFQTQFTNVDAIRKVIRARLEKGESWKENYCQYDPKGKARWFMINAVPIKNGDGEVIRWIGFNTDITEEKLAQKKLRISEERYELAALATEDIIWDWDLLTDKIQWNQAMAKTQKHNLSNLVTEADWWKEHIHPEDRERVVEKITRHIEFGLNEWRDEYRFIKGDGGITYVQDRGYILFNEGVPVRMVGAFRDVTWQRKIIEEISEARKNAEAANAAKSSFLANVSHEVRTPLSSIMGYLELIKTGKVELEETLPILERNGEQIMRIIDDVLDLAKVEQGSIQVKKKVFKVEELLNDMRSIMEPKALRKNIFFQIEKARDLPEYLCTDNIRLRQIMLNLALNAIKFTEKGGVILSLSYRESCLNIKVKDTGPGIPEELREDIFEPFNQGDSSVPGKFGGSGLGLALTKKICELMEGSLLLLDSEVGKGSLFQAQIKASIVDSDIKPAKGESEQAIGALKGKSILVVDDSPEIRMLVQRLLGKVGARVEAAASGEKAIEMASRGSYDVILLDIQMPGLDGYKTIEGLKKAGVKTPVVALTAHAMKQDKEKAMKAGFSAFATKPMKVETIIKTVQGLP